MQEASEEVPSGMMSVFCGPQTKLGLAMEVSRAFCKQKHHIQNPVCQVANYLYPDCKVIAGHEQVCCHSNLKGVYHTSWIYIYIYVYIHTVRCKSIGYMDF